MFVFVDTCMKSFFCSRFVLSCPLVLVLAMSVGLSGCLSLTPQKAQSHIITSARSSIATSRQGSNQLNTALLMSGYQDLQTCFDGFDGCLDDVNANFLNTNDPITQKNRLALLSELHYAHALYLGGLAHCNTLDRPPIDAYYANAPKSKAQLQSEQTQRQQCSDDYRQALYHTINHSYAYLFFDELTGTQHAQNFVQENDIKTQDIYHLATSALIDELYKQGNGAFHHALQAPNSPTTNEYNQQLANSYQINGQSVHLYIDDSPLFLSAIKDAHTLSDLVSAYDGRMAKLTTTSIRSGLGVGYVGVLSERHSSNAASSSSDPKDRVHPTGHVILTAIAKPQGDRLDSVLGSNTINIHLFNPYRQKTVEIFNKSYPLSANFSAGYAMWLGESHLNQLAILTMLQNKATPLPELFMLEPYNPDKKVVIMVHGLASSPATWVNFTNNLLADPLLRDNYQVWQIFYSTNLPILENRHQIQTLINAAYQMTDPQGTHPASKNSVIIGHSMGGIISRMMVSDDDLSDNMEELAYLVSSNKSHPKHALPPLHLNEQDKAELRQRFTLHALPQVDTAVFISSPFRGTSYAERWFTLLARKIIRLPLDLTENATRILTNSTDGLDEPLSDSQLKDLYLQNGASQLSDRSAFMALTANIHIKDNVRYHTIMGDVQGLYEKNPNKLADIADKLSDGIVPYQSSHLSGAASETIITGGHSIHENPKTVRKLRQILHEHLADVNNK